MKSKILKHLLLPLFLFASSQAMAGAMASGSAGNQTRHESFWGSHGQGKICIAVVAGLTTNAPPAGAPNACTTGTALFLPGVATGTERRKAKAAGTRTADSFSQSVTGGIFTASGIGAWVYDSGSVTSDATYTANSSIAPKPTAAQILAGPLIARTISTDPASFDAVADGTATFDAQLNELVLEPPESPGEASFHAGEALDDLLIYSLAVTAGSGFTGIGDLVVDFSSILGPSWDALVVADLIDKLFYDAVLGRVELTAPVTLLTATDVAYTAGSHSVSSGVAAIVIAVAEPTSLAMLATVLLVLVARRKRA